MWYTRSPPLSPFLVVFFTLEPGVTVTEPLGIMRFMDLSAPLVLRQGIQWHATCCQFFFFCQLCISNPRANRKLNCVGFWPVSLNCVFWKGRGPYEYLVLSSVLIGQLTTHAASFDHIDEISGTFYGMYFELVVSRLNLLGGVKSGLST